MATIDDVRPAILELEVYDGIASDDEAVELTATLLDLQNNTLPFIKAIRERGAQAFGMLFFQSNSTEWPKQGVLWTRFTDGI